MEGSDCSISVDGLKRRSFDVKSCTMSYPSSPLSLSANISVFFSNVSTFSLYVPGPGSLLKYSLSSSLPSNRKSLLLNGTLLAELKDFVVNDENDAAVFLEDMSDPALWSGRLKMRLADLVG